MPHVRPRHVLSHREPHLPSDYPSEGSRTEGHRWNVLQGPADCLVLRSLCPVSGGARSRRPGFHGSVHVPRVAAGRVLVQKLIFDILLSF